MSEAAKRGLTLPVLDSILVSNETHLRNCIQMVIESGKKRIGLVGLTFKEGTDDLRESPSRGTGGTLARQRLRGKDI